MNVARLSAIDKYIFLFLNGNHNSYIDGIILWVNDMFIWLPVYAIVLIALINFFRKEINSFLNVLLAFMLLVFLFVLSFQVLPHLFENFHRVKPCYNPEISGEVRLVGEACSCVFAFFTPRTCLAFSLFTFLFFALSNKLKGIKYFLLGWALLVSYGRIYAGAHYPLNVFAGSLIGIISGYSVYRIYSYIRNEFLLI